MAKASMQMTHPNSGVLAEPGRIARPTSANALTLLVVEMTTRNSILVWKVRIKDAMKPRLSRATHGSNRTSVINARLKTERSIICRKAIS